MCGPVCDRRAGADMVAFARDFAIWRMKNSIRRRVRLVAVRWRQAEK